MTNNKKTRLAIFASGSGSNAENIANYFNGNPSTEVALILTNNENAGVLERAQRLQIDSVTFNSKDFRDPNEVLKLIQDEKIDMIILAGFLLLVPAHFITAFPDKIINIHPALLPKYGGKGMYGDKVHQAVRESDDKETGITIHWVNSRYDEGQIIFQESCLIDQSDTVQSIASKVHELEYEHYPRVIEAIVNKVADF